MEQINLTQAQKQEAPAAAKGQRANPKKPEQGSSAKEPQPEVKQLATREQRPLAKAGFTFLPTTWSELFGYAKEICTTEFVPNAMRGKPGAVLAAWQTGQEVGLGPMVSLQSICIINGRPAIHSNGYWALITSHPLCEWFKETPPDEALKQGYGECTIKRRGNPHPITRRFSMEEAKTAGLLGKDNWKNYPSDMLQNRARHRAGDDAIPEACAGILPADIARDLDPVDVTPPTQEDTQPEEDGDGESQGITMANLRALWNLCNSHKVSIEKFNEFIFERYNAAPQTDEEFCSTILRKDFVEISEAIKSGLAPKNEVAEQG